MAVYLTLAENFGFFLVDQHGTPASAMVFATVEAATNYCDRVGWLLCFD